MFALEAKFCKFESYQGYQNRSIIKGQMKYSLERSRIKTGDALFFSGGNWKSWYGIQIMLVRMFKPSKFSHVGMAWVANNRVFIMEAVGSGVRLFPLSQDLPANYISRPTELSEEALEYAFGKLGVKYPAKWKMFFNKGLGSKFDLDGRMDCSDFFLAILDSDNEVLQCAADPSSICDELMNRWGALISLEKDPIKGL